MFCLSYVFGSSIAGAGLSLMPVQTFPKIEAAEFLGA
jgi:hypothetical protein